MRRTSQKVGFSENSTALKLLSKVPPCTIIVVQDRFFFNYIEDGANTLKSSSTFQLPTKIMFGENVRFFGGRIKHIYL